MLRSLARATLVALVAVAAIYGCDEESSTPTDPEPLSHEITLKQQICGEDTYLMELDPALVDWQDSLTAWQPDLTLDSPPAWEGGPVPVHLALLVPVLQQWQGAINPTLTGDTLAVVDGFDAGATTTQAYLSYLSGLLLDWETILEAAEGSDFLATPPTFAPDETPPMLECPADTTFACADTAGVVLEFEVMATDDCDEAPMVVCEPASGSTFRPGTTTVTCTATDAVGNESTCSFEVTVEADTTAPTLDCPEDMTFSCADTAGVMVEYEVTATDECDEAPTVVCDPPSGTVFGDGTTTVTCTATDAVGNESTCSFDVIVEVDDEAPMIDCPADIFVDCSMPEGAVVDFEVTAMDACDEAPMVVTEPASGSVFPVGTTTVTATATDWLGNTSTCTFDVTVEQAEVMIHDAAAVPAMLWSPNHKLVDIDFDLDIQNDCELDLVCTVLEVTSNEPIDGRGDGNTEPDWVILDDGGLQLRAERSGLGSDRIYTVRLRCEHPGSGIGDEAVVEVVVPHDQGRR